MTKPKKGYSNEYRHMCLFIAKADLVHRIRVKEKILPELKDAIYWCKKAKEVWDKALLKKERYPSDELMAYLKESKRQRLLWKKQVAKIQKEYERAIKSVELGNEWVIICQQQVDKISSPTELT